MRRRYRSPLACAVATACAALLLVSSPAVASDHYPKQDAATVLGGRAAPEASQRQLASNDPSEVVGGKVTSPRLEVVNNSIIGIYFRFKDIPRGATVTIRVKGCQNRVVKRVVAKKAGTYKQDYVIMRADKKFGNALRWAAVIEKENYASQRHWRAGYDLSRTGWHCPRAGR